MKRVLVTGATGFIGNYVVQQLLLAKYEVIATSSSIDKAKNYNWYGLVTYIPLDFSTLNSSVDYFSYFKKPDIIIHLAWEGLPNYKSLFHFEGNLPRHYLLLKNLILNGAKDLTVTGTCFEYGRQEGALDEQLPTLPNNPYALAKDCLRKFLEELKKQHEFSFKWVRLFYMFGKGQNENSLFSQLDKAIYGKSLYFNMSGGEQIRDFLPVEKIAEDIIQCSVQNQIEGIINCGSGIPRSIKSLVGDYIKNKQANIQMNLGVYPYSDFEPMEFWAVTEKLSLIKNYNYG